MTGFWDASALVAVCVPLQGAPEARLLLHQYKPVVWWGTSVEIWSAVIRLVREGVLTERQQQNAADRLSALRSSWREVQPTIRVRELAESHLTRYKLRAADSLQLAAALDWCSERPKHRYFFSRDRSLADAARQAGFMVIDSD